jgi:large subunit ribosomal protein L13
MDLFKTYQPTQKDVVRQTHELDAENQVLGRLASQVTTFLMGKHKVNYSAHMDSGDFVTVKNVDKIAVTGGKENKKVYYKHSGFPGGFKEVKYMKLLTENPKRILEKAVYNMLPGNRLRDKRMRRLKFV